MSVLPLTSAAKAIRDPSGDQSGKPSEFPALLIRVRPDPSGRTSVNEMAPSDRMNARRPFLPATVAWAGTAEETSVRAAASPIAALGTNQNPVIAPLPSRLAPPPA